MRRVAIGTVLFDLDGTLVRTEGIAAQTLEDVLRARGIAIEPEDRYAAVGRTWAAAMERLCPKYVSLVERDAFTREIMAEYRKRIAGGVEVIPGAVEFVRAVASEFQVALVSGSSREEIGIILNGLGVLGSFRFFLGSEDYPRSKPSPDGYLKAMELLSARPEETVVFEDSAAGIAAARAAGARVVAIRAAAMAGQDLGAADRSIDDFSGVDAEWVRRLS